MNIPFTGFQTTLMVWGAIMLAIIALVPHEIEVIGVVIFIMFMGLLVSIGMHDVSVYYDRDRWLKFRENKND